MELRGSFKPLLTDWEKGRVEEFDIDEKPLQKEISYDTVLEALESVEVRLTVYEICRDYAARVRVCFYSSCVVLSISMCARTSTATSITPPPPTLCRCRYASAAGLYLSGL